MTQTFLLSRLALLTAASTVLALLLLWVFQAYFSDILPLADAEMPPPTWRFQGAFLLTILLYVTTAIAFMSLIGLIALIGKRYLPEQQSRN